MLLFLPSPSTGVWHLGPIPIRGYALSIMTGIVIACIIAWRRWRRWGGDTNQLENIALISIIIGIIGARVYWIIIEWQMYFGPGGVWYHMFFIWEGGLGIWGAITGGFLTAWLLCRKYHIRFLRLADCIAPAFLIAQGVGRLGNWWNQEVYGKPSTLPWALEIAPAHRVPGYEQYATFQPTFLYEMIWDFAGAGFLFWAEKKWKLGRGKLFALYIITYATGRFLIELIRIDPVEVIWGLRVNSWATMIGGIVGIILFCWLLKNRPGPNEILPLASTKDAADAVKEAAKDAQVSSKDDGADTDAETKESAEAEDEADSAGVSTAKPSAP